MSAIKDYSRKPEGDYDIKGNRIKAVDAALELLIAHAGNGESTAGSYAKQVAPLADAIQAAIEGKPTPE